MGRIYRWWWPDGFIGDWWICRFCTRLRYLFTGDCGYACHYDKTYGFVPEADCPVHDIHYLKLHQGP